MQSIIGRVGRTFLYDPWGWDGANWNPAEDVVETDQQTIIKLDVPGLKKEDLQVRIQNGLLRVSGSREESKDSKLGEIQRMERTSGSFSRYYRLEQDTQPDQIHANLQDGVLELKVPRPEASKTVEIPIGDQLSLEEGPS